MRIFIFMMVLNVVFFAFPHHDCKDKKRHVILVDSTESRNSFISYVKIDGNDYIFKQKKDATKQFSVVRDALAAYIASSLGIAHSVKKIIASKESFPGKRHVAAAGVILTIAPGRSVRDQPESKYSTLCLKQRTIDGDLLPHRWLTEVIINQITWHEQLPIIIGLDLFICNTDRHGDNLFYDPDTDNFCAIDMDAVYRRDLPALACQKLKKMIYDKKKFTREEVKALVKVRDTLQFLLNHYPVQAIIARLHAFIKEADFSKEILRSEKTIKKIMRHEKIIVQSRHSLYKLIKILNKIVIN